VVQPSPPRTPSWPWPRRRAGAVGVVRLSGPAAPAIAQRLTGRASPFTPRHATLAAIRDLRITQHIVHIDQAVVTWFAAPQSYTGEDVVEISGHGSPWLLQEIVELACREGASWPSRASSPCARTSTNGWISSRRRRSPIWFTRHPAAGAHRAGSAGGHADLRVQTIDARLFDVVARLEASLDFPTRAFTSSRAPRLCRILTACARICAGFWTTDAGRLIREGRMVVIAGGQTWESPVSSTRWWAPAAPSSRRWRGPRGTC